MITVIVVTLNLMDNSSAFFVNMGVNSIFYEEFLVMFRLKREKNTTSTTIRVKSIDTAIIITNHTTRV